MDTPSPFLRQEAKSRPGAQVERTRLAAELRDARQESSERRERVAEVKEWLEHNVSEQARKTEGELRDLANQIDQAKKDLEALRGNMFQAVWNRKEIRRLRKEIGMLQLKERLTQHEVDFHEGAAAEAQKNLSVLESNSKNQEPQDILNAYYRDEQQRWEQQDVGREDLERYMSVENLSQLDMASYIDLLKRFPAEMVTHVSRRGVRDHADLMYHQRGVGEVSDAFDNVLESGRLQSNISLKLEQDQRDTYIADQIGLEQFATREEAYEAVDQLVSETGWSSFADHSAVHFATEVVADSYYGSERQNEVFVAFPSALIASEYAFGGYHGQDLSTPHADMQQNDLWVWEKDQEGIPIDAGVVFLPRDTQVDHRTGSRYAIGEQGEALPNQARFDTIKKSIEDGQLGAIARRLEQSYTEAQSAGNDFERFNMKQAAKEQAREEVGNALALSEEERDSVAENLFELSRLTRYVDAGPDSPPGEQLDYQLQKVLQGMGLYFQEAHRTVPARDYWESYFAEHPDRRPSKIVYYTGDSPTQALRTWKEENGLIKTYDDVSVDLNARRESYAQDTATQSRFRDIAREVIDRHFDAIDADKNTP